MFQKTLLKQNLCSEMVLLVDEVCRIIWANQKALDFFSLDKSELFGCHLGCFNVFSPISVMLKKGFKENGEFSYSSTYMVEIRDKGLTTLSYFFQIIPAESTRFALISISNESDFYNNIESTINAQRLLALGTLMKGFAHDFNNVFTGIISHLDLVLSSKDAHLVSPEVLSYLSSAESMARRGAMVVNKLQSLVGSQSPYSVQFDLGEFINEIVVVLRHCLGRKIKISDFNKPPHMCLVSADQNRIFQIFVNLCLNARDSMPAGGTISIFLEEFNLDNVENAFRKPGKYWKITVADTGSGIPQDVMDKLFTPFFSTKTGNESIGLGLFVSLKIVESLGGWMTVDSKYGEGTKVSFYLPALTSSLQCIVPKFESRINLFEKFKGTQTVLVVDDEEGVRQILARTLSAAGYKVLEASSCAQVKQLLSQSKINDIQLVILDINLEDGFGTSIINEIKSKVDAKIVILSGELTDTSIEKAVNYNVDACLNKPFYPIDALQIVHTCLNTPK